MDSTALNSTNMLDLETNSTQVLNCLPPAPARVVPTTPLQNGQPANVSSNMMTVTRTRTRQKTITVESQTSKEVDAAFEEIKQMKDLDDPVEELRRRMQRLFTQKENEWSFKINEAQQTNREELALCKIKLNVVLKTISSAENFMKSYKPNEQVSKSMPPTPSSATKPLSPVNGIAGRAFSPDALVDAIKERDTLRDELRELENSYSDLFKRYEKMRENCVLLKNSEESLKKTAEDDAAKYDRLLSMYSELRATAANELNKANHELDRVQKQHEENTLNLRCRLRKNESEINALSMTITGKEGQIEELNRLCDELMRKNGVFDEVQSETSFDDFSCN